MFTVRRRQNQYGLAISFVAGVAVGSRVMYLFDPVSGKSEKLVSADVPAYPSTTAAWNNSGGSNGIPVRVVANVAVELAKFIPKTRPTTDRPAATGTLCA